MIRRSLISGDNGGGESKRSDSGLGRTKANLLCSISERRQRKPHAINEASKRGVIFSSSRTSLYKAVSASWMCTRFRSSSSGERILWPRVAPRPTRPLAPLVAKRRPLLAQPATEKQNFSLFQRTCCLCSSISQRGEKGTSRFVIDR